MEQSLKPPYLAKDGQRGDFQVWIVNGAYIRGHTDEEFTNFGQHYRYPYIPDKEFWLDQEAEHDERRFFIDHLLVEHKLMAKGAPYVNALTQANQAERKERRRGGPGQSDQSRPLPPGPCRRPGTPLEGSRAASPSGSSTDAWCGAPSTSTSPPGGTTTFTSSYPPPPSG